MCSIRTAKIGTDAKHTGFVGQVGKVPCVSGVTRRIRSEIRAVETVDLGKTGVQVSPLGVGAFSWGESFFWGYGDKYGKNDVQGAYKACIDGGITYIDTAELYGFGESERLLGEFMKQSGTSPMISTKFPPYPWRLSRKSVVSTLRQSLERLQLTSVGLYMIHWPGFLLNTFSNDAYLEGLADCVDEGLTQAVGVSNFNEDRLRFAHRILAARGIPLASNQVQYSLLYRKPEHNGVLKTCKELGVTVCAYGPLSQGVLTGKFNLENLPTGGRKNTISPELLQGVQPLLQAMKKIGDDHDGKTLSQVAINWTLCKNVLPIVGAKNKSQVEEAVGSLGWHLTADEIELLDHLSAEAPTCMGAPYENW